jgi:hypothetical protein
VSRAAHKITRVVFEIGLRGREHVTTIQNRVSVFAGGPLETVLIESLSALAGEDHLVALADIELNIGNISYQRLEEDLAVGIARCLREWALRLPLHRLQSMEPTRGLKESGGSSRENVRYLPGPAASRFSFGSAGRGGLNAAIAAALQGPGDWPQLMAAVRDNHAFRCRLANEVSPELLRDLLQALVPIDGSMMAEISGVLASLHHCVASASTDSHAFRRLLWECILNGAARHHPARFSLRSFIADVLAQISARYSLGRSVISSRIRESLWQHGQAAPTITLPTISPSLRQALFDWVEAESLTQPGAAPVPQDAGTARSSQPIDQLAMFLEWGALPGFAVSGSRRDIDSDMLKSMAASPEAVCSLVRNLGEIQPVRKRIAGQLSEQTVQRLLGALDPVNAPWIFLCQQSLRRLHAQKPLVPLQNRIFAQLLQELALEYLVERHWHALDALSFMRFLLQGLAARQKTEYQLLLADVALRRSPKSRNTGAQLLVNSAIVTLLEEDLLGIRGPLLAAPRFVVRSAFQHLYCDLDVLAYWLRWRKLPAWSFAATPEEMAGRIGPLLRDLPPAVRANAVTPQDKAATVSAGIADASRPALQIEHWLLYGIWPASISLPQNTSLAEWLESQSDSDWLEALRRCGAQDSAVQRVLNHLSPVFLVRIASLLAGSDAQVACGLLCGLSDLKRHIGATISQHWEELVRRYTLTYLLRHASSYSHELSCIEELAQTILQALSLNCQVPYERLLLLLRQESQGKEAQLDLCLKLQAKLDHLEAKTDAINRELLAGALADGPDLVLHYPKHGSLPENASGLSFHALQQLAGRGINTLFPPVAGAEKENIKPALEESKSKVSTLPRDTIAELAATEQSEDGIQDQEAELQVLGHFLRTGDMPWWGHPLLSLSSGRFQSLLENQPEPVLQMLRASVSTPQAINRVMRYLPQPDIAAIILKSVAGYGGILILYIAAGTELAKSCGLSKLQGSRVPGIHWRETLLFVLDGEPSKSLPYDALRTLCARIAQKLDLEISHYLEKLSHIASRHTTAKRGYAALAEMLFRMQTSAANIKENKSIRENESGNSLEPDAKAQRRGSGEPDLREATGPTACEREGSLPALRCDNIEKTELAEGLAFPDETVLTGQVEHLLRYGVLPQTMLQKSLSQFMDDLAQAFITYPEKFRKQMRKAAGCSLERKRIAWLFSPQALRHLWPLLLPSSHEQAVLCLEALSAAAISCSGGGVNASLRMACVEELLHVAGRAEKSRWETAAFLRRAIRRLQENHSLHPIEVVEHLRKEFAAHTSGVREKLCRVLDRVERETSVAPIMPLGKSSWAVPESRRIPRAQKTPAPLPAGEPFYVGNAGAILLWPFLGRYFQMLALLEKNSLCGEEEQSRAIHLVQYLATGKLEAPEHELLLNKLLCGARPEQPLHPVTAVTAAEEDISRQLLNSVIQTWKKIRNTSVDGLRQSFLVREGQLLRRDSDDSWLLTVSARSYDMLLDSLPWRLSPVRQPWMQTTLHVKWR